MCGIAGFLGTGSEETLAKMCDALSRRGPDDHGTYSGGGIGLAHTRLAIIDLSDSGHQPMKSENAVVAFNGEIYNFKEIRRDLRGYSFRTQSDTETILAVYETHGVDGFAMLDGMFAFALYDTRTKTMHLVRDRFGKKPLYWTLMSETLVFGSELKALMCHERFKKEIDPVALSAYLAHEYVPTPLAIFKGVQKLAPATYLSFQAGSEPTVSDYWKHSSSISHEPFDDAVARTDALLGTAVEKRLVSDVPLGVFLSGGIDSSAVAYYARECGPIRTFAIGFEEQDFDESRYAREVADALGTLHTEARFSAARCIELVPEVFGYLDEPMADASILPTYLLSAFTRTHVTVALGGDGGDELFAGYPTFHAEAIAAAYARIPRVIRTALIEPLIQNMPANYRHMSVDFRLKKFIEGAALQRGERHARWLGAFTDDQERRELLRIEDASNPFAIGSADSPNELLWQYMRTYLMDEVLVKVDRASMAHGLEVRTPFLDTALVEYVSSLPYGYKHRGFTGKRLLKEVMRGKIPDSIIDRKKKGFGIPLSEWLRADMNALMHELLSEDALKASGVFTAAVVQRLVREHESGVKDNRKKLWTLMVFQMWHRTWMR